MDSVILGAASDGVLIFGTAFGAEGGDSGGYADLIDEFIEKLEDELER